MTAAFALGQIAGPIASTLASALFPAPQAGMRIALLGAAALLAASAFWLQQSIPIHQPTGATR